MKNINRPEYDVNQIASFITENVDEINVPSEKPTNPMPPRFAGKVNPDGSPRDMARTDLDTRKSIHHRRREYKAARAAEGQGMETPDNTVEASNTRSKNSKKTACSIAERL